MSDQSLFSQSFDVVGGDFLSAGKASTGIKAILREIGIDASVIRRVAIAAYEAEMNVVLYARKGVMRLKVTPKDVRIAVEDEGDGIADIDLAMQEGYSTASDEIRELGFGAGMGLPNIKRNADEFSISSVPGSGTRLEMLIGL